MSGGGGRYFPSSSPDLQRRIERATHDAERQHLEGEINDLMSTLFAKFNARDAESAQERIQKIKDTLGDKVDIDTFLFGGSVAKHTYVDGLSDVDALVVMDPEGIKGKTPRALLNRFHRILSDELDRSDIDSITKGKLAVTITYRDGSEIQLLPALRKGTGVAIPSSSGKTWNEINPRAFTRALTRANERLNGRLIPSIKLMKSVNDGLPKQKRTSGYHIEALALEAVKGYRGEKTVRALLLHVLETSAKRVMTPIKDVTKQSRIVDAHLGSAHSAKRRLVADGLAAVSRKLEGASTVEQWRSVLEV